MSEIADALAAARPVAVRHARRLTGDDHAAEELVEDVLAGLWERSLDTGQVYGVPYVLRSVRNAWIDAWRRRHTEEAALPLLTLAEPEDDQARRDARIDVHELLERLPARQRTLVELRYLDDLSQREVAERLHLPAGTVASGTARALARLRKLAAA